MSEAIYRAAPASTLRIVPIDDLTAVYHRASGVTHLLASPAPELMAMLADQAMTLAELLARLSADFELLDADLPALGARLDELVRAGLVERR